MSPKSRLMPVLLLLLTTLAIVQFSIAISSSTPSYEWFDPLIDVRGVLIDRHLNLPDEEAMQESAIKAMIESLDDPYALFVPVEKEEGGADRPFRRLVRTASRSGQSTSGIDGTRLGITQVPATGHRTRYRGSPVRAVDVWLWR